MAKKVTSGYTEDWLPVRGIQNGFIITTNNQKVTGVKITPRNIFILDPQAQDNVLISLKNFYNMLDFEFWLVVADRPVDISVYMAQLQLLYNNVQTPVLKKLVMQDINKANLFMSKEVGVADTEYYILFRERRPEIMQKRIQNLISGLATCGLMATQTTNDDLRVLLDGFLNAGSKTEFGTVMGS